jgi:hypothetical protein
MTAVPWHLPEVPHRNRQGISSNGSKPESERSSNGSTPESDVDGRLLPRTWCGVWGLGFGVWGSGFRVWVIATNAGWCCPGAREGQRSETRNPKS